MSVWLSDPRVVLQTATYPSGGIYKRVDVLATIKRLGLDPEWVLFTEHAPRSLEAALRSCMKMRGVARKTFGEMFKNALAIRGVTRKQCGAALGLSEGQVAAISHGESGPRAEWANTIVPALAQFGITRDEIDALAIAAIVQAKRLVPTRRGRMRRPPRPPEAARLAAFNGDPWEDQVRLLVAVAKGPIPMTDVLVDCFGIQRPTAEDVSRITRLFGRLGYRRGLAQIAGRATRFFIKGNAIDATA